MPEVYRKWGRTIRYESGKLIRVEEAGEAVEDGEYFECHPSPRREWGEGGRRPGEGRITEILSRLRPPHPLSIERVLIATGESAHEFGSHRWTDTYERIHIALTNARLRVLIEKLEDFEPVANAFATVKAERATPALTLAPAVTAALLPNLIGIAPPNITLIQTAGGVDGKGEPIEERDAADPINWYRPSYRVRPIRVAFNIRAVCSVRDIDTTLPRAIALLEPAQGLTFRALCVAGDDVFPTTFRITRIEAIAESLTLYPYGAGSFGAEMTVF